MTDEFGATFSKQLNIDMKWPEKVEEVEIDTSGTVTTNVVTVGGKVINLNVPPSKLDVDPKEDEGEIE